MSGDIAAHGSLRILVVDDDASVRRSISRSLQSRGYRLREAASAGEARKLALAEPPDLVIMDLVLSGMEGREAANLLLAHQPELAVLFISGYSSQESARMGKLGAGQLFLRKPFDARELLDAVRRALGEESAA